MQAEYLTVDEAAVLMLIDRETIVKWFDEGLPYEERGGERLVRHADLDAFLVRNGQGLARDASEA
jgi:excisionase family DNA binding protein